MRNKSKKLKLDLGKYGMLNMMNREGTWDIKETKRTYRGYIVAMSKIGVAYAKMRKNNFFCEDCH